MSQSCIYTSVTLQTSEQYVLPAGAVIVSATDPTKITSVNNCADLSQLETAGCYGFFISESDSNGDAAYDEVKVQGITVGDVYYPFTTEVNIPKTNGAIPISFINNFTNQLNLLSIGPLFSNFTGWVDGYPNSGDATYTTMVCFKTIPSIATGALIKCVGVASTNFTPIPFFVPIQPANTMLTTYLTSDPDFAANCGCNS
jgi:hypothetical protein